MDDKASGWVEECRCGAQVIHPNIPPTTFHRAELYPAPVDYRGDTITYHNVWLTPVPGRDPPTGFNYCTHPLHQCPGPKPRHNPNPTLF